jgi:hypothetical protein
MATELGTLFDEFPHSGKMNEKGPYTHIDEFFTTVKNAQAGDLITLANGEYDVKSVPPFKERRGTAENPIVVRAEEPGKVILKGSAGYRFDKCTYFTWYGFHHAHKSSTGGSSNISFSDGNNNRFARCEINLDDTSNSKRHWLRISNCEAMKVDHCYFHHKKSEGQFCNVFSAKDNEPGKGPLFEYNYFQHQDFGKHLPRGIKYGDAGGEAIQMGHSKQARRYYRAIVRYNYFEQCNGDGEIITNKSSGNLYYNNTFTDNDGSLVLRHGDSTAVLANYFKNCGLRVCGADNLIANNHFTENSREDSSRQPLVIMNGNIERPKGAYPKDRNYERVVNNDIILNTLANGDGTAKQIVLWGSRKSNSLKPYNNRFKGNIITGKHGKLFEFGEGTEKDPNDISFNIVWAEGRKDDEREDEIYGGLKKEEMANRIDPELERDAEDGICRLRENSKACSRFEGTPFNDKTNVDIYGVSRSGHTDAGCHQHTKESNRPKRPVTPKDVGVSAPTPWLDSPVWNPQGNRTDKSVELPEQATTTTEPHQPPLVTAAAADKYGIQFLYPNPSTPQMCDMNMDNPFSDTNFRNEENANLKKESDGAWSSTGNQEKQQVRLELWQDPSIRDCEITVYANYIEDLSLTGSYGYQVYRGGGHHGSAENGCPGCAYKARIRKDKTVVIAKEIKHADYSSNEGNVKKLSKDIKGRYIGVKQVVYNLSKLANGRTPVKIEVWCDEEGMTPDGVLHPEKQNWQKYAETIDKGGWTAGNGAGCPPVEIGNTGTRKGDEILNTPEGAKSGNLAAYRTDGAKTKIKYFSIRKIQAPIGA